MSERNLDAKGVASTLYPGNNANRTQETMLTGLFGIFARCAIAAGTAFILSKTAPSMPNKMCRFVFLFVLLVPFNFVVNYLDAAAWVPEDELD